jgi:hypothetical protein
VACLCPDYALSVADPANAGLPRPATQQLQDVAIPPHCPAGETASWRTDEHDALDGRRPVDVLDGDPDTVVAAAHREAADWDFDTGAAAGWR